MAQPSTSKMSIVKRVAVFYAPVTGLLLLLLATSVWCNRYLFDTDNFSSTATAALTEDSTSMALANEVTDRLLENRPLLKRTINDRVVGLVAALLKSDLSDRVMEKSVSRLQVMLTTNNPKPVEIDLTTVKSVLTQVLALGRVLTDRPVEDQKINPDTIPDKITLIDPSTLPNFYGFGLTMMWLAPVLLLSVLALTIYPIYRAARTSLVSLKHVLAIQGGIILAFGFLALFIGPLIKPPVLANITSSNIRVVVDNVIDAFISAFNGVATAVIIWPAIILLVAALCLQLWPTVHKKITELTTVRTAKPKRVS